MKHASDITYNDVKEGDSFRYNGHFFDDERKEFIKCEKVAIIDKKIITKSGRIKLLFNGNQSWSNGAKSPTSKVQIL